MCRTLINSFSKDKNSNFSFRKVKQVQQIFLLTSVGTIEPKCVSKLPLDD